jgi:hypothetical protein
MVLMKRERLTSPLAPSVLAASRRHPLYQILFILAFACIAVSAQGTTIKTTFLPDIGTLRDGHLLAAAASAHIQSSHGAVGGHQGRRALISSPSLG